MKQLNVNLSDEDESNLETLLKSGRAHSRSGAVREALRMAAQFCRLEERPDYGSLVGMLRDLPDNASPRFQSDRDLWE
jgi:metal-responsive CopG/Arc/MetJ family transcriptional regulator